MHCFAAMCPHATSRQCTAGRWPTLPICKLFNGQASDDAHMHDVQCSALFMHAWHSGATTRGHSMPAAAQVADTQWRKMQYLYMDDEGVHVMDADNFEQYCVPKAAAEGVMGWLQDDLEVTALMHDGSPVVVAMPPTQITVQVLPPVSPLCPVSGSHRLRRVSHAMCVGPLHREMFVATGARTDQWKSGQRPC
jgi:hypothetical protein